MNRWIVSREIAQIFLNDIFLSTYLLIFIFRVESKVLRPICDNEEGTCKRNNKSLHHTLRAAS